MIPSLSVLTEEITEPVYASKTYRILFTGTINRDNGHNLGITMLINTVDADRLSGYVDGLEAVAQTVYITLSTERYKFIIYSWDHGIELVDLFGKPIPYVISELPRRIKDALIQDDRITDVVDFKFEKNGKRLHTSFTVLTDIGKISTALEMDV